MAQYIPKEPLLAEIEKLIDKGKYHDDYNCVFRDGNNAALYALKERLDTLEVKDVDSNDAFIEKACSWLKSKCGFTIGFSGAEIKDFQNYMQNESR